MGARNRGGIGLSYRPPGYIGWRNSFLGIDSWAPVTFKNTGSGRPVQQPYLAYRPAKLHRHAELFPCKKRFQNFCPHILSYWVCGGGGGFNWKQCRWTHPRVNFNRAGIFKRVWGSGIDSKEWIPPAYVAWAGIFKQSMGARNRVGIGLSYRPARLHRLVEFIPWNWFLGSMNV